MNSSLISVVLVDDHPGVRRGLKQLLEQANDIQVIGEASDGEEAISLVQSKQPDVVILDVHLPKLRGDQVAQRLLELEIQTNILALSSHDDRQYVLSMLECGAAGYITKDEAPQMLAAAVRGVAQGEKGWLSPSVRHYAS